MDWQVTIDDHLFYYQLPGVIDDEAVAPESIKVKIVEIPEPPRKSGMNGFTLFSGKIITIPILSIHMAYHCFFMQSILGQLPLGEYCWRQVRM